MSQLPLIGTVKKEQERLIAMSFYEKVLRPVLFLTNPEKIHDAFVFFGQIGGSNPLFRGVLSILFNYKNPVLEQNILGMRFKNPLGLAAGFDKDCKLMKTMPVCGFGYEEVGSVTAQAYGGNPKPRLKRIPKDKGIIVNYGLKNEGAKACKKRFFTGRKKKNFSFPVGVNVAKTNKEFADAKERLSDWAKGIRLMKNCGDYITINLSCPNTHDCIDYCNPKKIRWVLAYIAKEKPKVPVFLKLRQGLIKQEIKDIITLADKHDFVKGFVLTNLNKDRSKLKTPKKLHEKFKGGVSGMHVKPEALRLTREFYKLAGKRYIIIGCGGIFNAKDAYDYIKAGASLVQMLTGMIYEGPRVMYDINKGLVELLKKDGYKNISEAIGRNAKK